MILEETMNKFIRDIINLIIEEAGFAIKGKQSAPRPITPYATVEFLSDTAIGWEQIEREDEADPSTKIKHDYTGAREIMFSLNFLKTSAIDNARKVRIGLVRESIVDLFHNVDMGIGIRSQVRDISNALEGTWEERAQFDLTLNAVGRDTDIIESIGSLDIDAEYQARGLKYNYNIEVTE